MESLLKKLFEVRKMKKGVAWLMVAIIMVTLAIPTGMNALAGTSNVEISRRCRMA